MKLSKRLTFLLTVLVLISSGQALNSRLYWRKVCQSVPHHHGPRVFVGLTCKMVLMRQHFLNQIAAAHRVMVSSSMTTTAKPITTSTTSISTTTTTSTTTVAPTTMTLDRSSGDATSTTTEAFADVTDSVTTSSPLSLSSTSSEVEDLRSDTDETSPLSRGGSESTSTNNQTVTSSGDPPRYMNSDQEGVAASSTTEANGRLDTNEQPTNPTMSVALPTTTTSAPVDKAPESRSDSDSLQQAPSTTAASPDVTSSEATTAPTSVEQPLAEALTGPQALDATGGWRFIENLEPRR